MTKTCARCGREFAAARPWQKYCGSGCARAARRRGGPLAPWTASDDYKALVRDIADALEDRDAALRHARGRPEWCSPARWRMELARRRNAALGREPPDATVYDWPAVRGRRVRV